MKIRRTIPALACLLLALLLLAGCKPKPLPDGVDEAALLDAGREVVSLLNAGEYEAVATLFRADIAQSITADTVEGLVSDVFAKAQAYQKETDCLATTGNDPAAGGDGTHVIAVLYCKHAKDDVMYRVAFDLEMNLIGLSVTKQ